MFRLCSSSTLRQLSLRQKDTPNSFEDWQLCILLCRQTNDKVISGIRYSSAAVLPSQKSAGRAITAHVQEHVQGMGPCLLLCQMQKRNSSRSHPSINTTLIPWCICSSSCELLFAYRNWWSSRGLSTVGRRDLFFPQKYRRKFFELWSQFSASSVTKSFFLS